MEKDVSRKYGFQLGVMIVLLILSSWLAILTYVQHDTKTTGTWSFLVENHVALMLFLIVVSIGFGFVWSMSLYREVERRKNDTEKLFTVIQEFLSNEERKIIRHLLEHNGKSSQAELSRIEGMNRVKTYRSLKKMKEKKLVSIHAHGKTKTVTLSARLQETLMEQL